MTTMDSEAVCIKYVVLRLMVFVKDSIYSETRSIIDLSYEIVVRSKTNAITENIMF